MERIAIYGVGAIGSVIGANLVRHGHDVTLVDPWREHVEAMKAGGLRVSEVEEEWTVPVRALHPWEVGERTFDVVIVAVKSYDTVAAVRAMLPHLAEGGFFVSAQNSINEEWIIPLVGRERVVGCVVTISAGLYEPGHALRTSAREVPALTLGEPDGSLSPRLQRLREVLSCVGPVRTTTNLWGERWSKLATNCMINSLAGITGYSSGRVRQDPSTQGLALRLGAEVVRVAQAHGVRVEPLLGGITPQELLEAEAGRPSPALEKLAAEGERRGEGRPSLLQDILKGRPTEVDYLNGLAVRKGEEVGVPTPVNAAALSLVKEVEAGRLRPDPSNLARLRD